MKTSFLFASVAIFLFVLISNGQAEVVPFDLCSDKENQCTIHEVRVTPCTSKKNNVCKIKTGTRASISFDFTPEFSTDKLFVQPYWGAVGFKDMDVDACKYTTCPVVNGKKQTYTFDLNVSKKHPKGAYTVNWLIGKSDSQKDRVTTDTIPCCFKQQIRLY